MVILLSYCSNSDYIILSNLRKVSNPNHSKKKGKKKTIQIGLLSRHEEATLEKKTKKKKNKVWRQAWLQGPPNFWNFAKRPLYFLCDDLFMFLCYYIRSYISYWYGNWYRYMIPTEIEFNEL